MVDHYSGPERRIEHRRQLVDRRQLIRFEMDKTPRRSGKDRRSHGESVWNERGRF